jgi:cytochrome c553
MRRVLFIVLSLAASGLAAQEAPPGATTCSGCHGAGSDLTLDGLTAQDIVAAMTAFRDGSRPATLMPRLAAGFTDEEIAAIAAWIAAGEDAE